jgi:hypothetical protein
LKARIVIYKLMVLPVTLIRDALIISALGP